MKIYRLRFLVDDYDNLIPYKHWDIDEILSFDGRNQTKNWKPLKVVRMEPGKKLPLGDAPGFNIAVFSKKAVDILYPIIKNDVEILPLDFDEGEFYVINVTTVLDCIDYKNSSYKTFKNSDEVMFFYNYSFKENIIENKNIFKIIDESRSKPFVSEEFVKLVKESGLQGFKFKLVYETGVNFPPLGLFD